MNEPSRAHPPIVPANLEALRRQLELLMREPVRQPASRGTAERDRREPPSFTAGK